MGQPLDHYGEHENAVFKMESWRLGSDSNRRIARLQLAALPLGYPAKRIQVPGSNRISPWAPVYDLDSAGCVGIEPTTFCFGDRCSTS